MSEPVAASANEGDIRPVVRTAAPDNRALWIFAAILLLGGLLLFQALNARRQASVDASVPAVQAGGAISAPPPLALPPGYAEPWPDELRRPPLLNRYPVIPAQAPVRPPAVTRVVERPVSGSAVSPPPLTQALAPPPRTSIAIERPQLAEPAPAPSTAEGNGRVSAGRLLNPALTVPQGVIIAAVLETALDSTRPGGVRAIVSRDVRSFDGSRVLIPRGSRLYGEYAADVTSGQKRALIRWQRLTRPDAVIINLDSPAADPLGRAGVAGKVDSHFLERFGATILQSVLDIGVGLATRSVTDNAVIVALPGSTPQVANQQQQQQAQVQPTLTVRQGTSVSVFVARDLDFSSVER